MGGSASKNAKKELKASAITAEMGLNGHQQVGLTLSPQVVEVSNGGEDNKTSSETDSLNSEFAHVAINDFAEMDLSGFTLMNTDTPVLDTVHKRYRPEQLITIVSFCFPSPLLHRSFLLASSYLLISTVIMP